jgi:hypothetical protein
MSGNTASVWLAFFLLAVGAAVPVQIAPQRMTTPMQETRFLRAALCLAVLVLPAPALAVEGGVSPYAKGFAGFMAGVLPPVGNYASYIFYYLHGSAGAVARNDIAELNVGANADLHLLEGTWVTDAPFLGGRNGASMAVSYLDTGLNATLALPTGAQQVKLHTGGISDSFLSPITLGWDSGNWHWNTDLLIYVPTGPYYTTQHLNVGKNIWAFMPQLGVTWFDPHSGLDVSGQLTYVTMTRNDATDYQSGDILHFDWGTGLHFGAKQEWELGVNGSVMDQLSGDSGRGTVLGPFKAQSFGVGPAITWHTNWENVPFSFTGKWERDFSSRDTIGGDVFMITATAVL